MFMLSLLMIKHSMWFFFVYSFIVLYFVDVVH